MWARLSILALLALSPFQTTVLVTFGWTDHPSHVDATWEVERNGTTLHPCGSVTVVGAERRCTAQLPSGTASYRLRGTKVVDGEALVGGWSASTGSQPTSAPGPFTVTFHKEGPPRPMAAPVFDQTSNPGTTFTGDTSWTHTPVGTPRAVTVFIAHISASGVDEIVGVTYGGVAMTQVTGSPQLKTTGEAMGLHMFFLGSGVPSGPQTVAIDTSAGTVVKAAECRTYTAGADVEEVDTVTWSSDSLANPSGTLSLGGRESLALEIVSSGQNAVTGITPLTNWTGAETDAGNFVIATYDYNVTGTADITVGWTQAAEDALGIAIALAEVVPPSAGNRRRRLLMGAR